jgi:hypothetical protein
VPPLGRRGDGRSKTTLTYRLPAGARQGTQDWYRLRMHFVVTFRRRGAGVAYVGAETNGRAAIQIEFERRRKRGRLQPMRWSSVDLIRGGRHHRTSKRTIEVVNENYLQNAGVRPDRNTLAFTLEQLGGLEIESLRVLPDSAIVVTGQSPPHLELDAVLPSGVIHAGEKFEIGFELRNRGDVPALDAGVSMEPPPPGLSLAKRSHRLGRLEGATTGRFRLRARRAGTYRLTMTGGATNANSPQVVIKAVVAAASRDGDGSSGLFRPMLAGLLIVGGVAWTCVALVRRGSDRLGAR